MFLKNGTAIALCFSSAESGAETEQRRLPKRKLFIPSFGFTKKRAKHITVFITNNFIHIIFKLELKK